jgi:nucleotide-binding universal stress UspA family protein
MKILIGVDDSPHSEAALEFVRKMTWPAGTRVVVASAVRPMVTVYSEVYVPPAGQPEGLMEEQVRFHQELVSRGEAKLQGAGLRTEARVLQGDPREAIVEAAKIENADLVVLGSHGRTGLAKLVMGSVADHIVAHAHCNVLVVKTPAKAG